MNCLLDSDMSVQGALVQPICANLVDQQMQWSAWQSTAASDDKASFDTFTQTCAKGVVSTDVMKEALRKQADVILKGECCMPAHHAPPSIALSDLLQYALTI